jgi:drug/metabolite transporter (DMT)-like permease
VTAIELGAGTLALTALAPLLAMLWPDQAGTPWVVPDIRDAVLLLLLALACTLLPFALSLVALRHMSAFSAQLAINLEPVYAIGLAILLLNEQRDLSPQFYVGVAIVLSAVFLHPLLARRHTVAQPEVLAVAEAKQVAE